MAEVLVDDGDLGWEERAAALRGETGESGVFEQQAPEFEPGRTRLDVREIDLCELHTAQR